MWPFRAKTISFVIKGLPIDHDSRQRSCFWFSRSVMAVSFAQLACAAAPSLRIASRCLTYQAS